MCICFQGKNIWQAEIDAAAELIDFLRFNIQFSRVRFTFFFVFLHICGKKNNLMFVVISVTFYVTHPGKLSELYSLTDFETTTLVRYYAMYILMSVNSVKINCNCYKGTNISHPTALTNDFACRTK